VGEPEGKRPLGRTWRRLNERKLDGAWTGVIWLRIGTGGELL